MSITSPNVRSSVMALAPRYARLLAALENSAKKIEGGAKTARSEVADLQRQAIASIQQCADIALRLAECLGDGACPRDITCLHLGDWNRCDVCFDEQVSRFFDQSGKFITASRRRRRTGCAHVAERRCHRFQLLRRLPRARRDIHRGPAAGVRTPDDGVAEQADRLPDRRGRGDRQGACQRRTAQAPSQKPGTGDRAILRLRAKPRGWLRAGRTDRIGWATMPKSSRAVGRSSPPCPTLSSRSA